MKSLTIAAGLSLAASGAVMAANTNESYYVTAGALQTICRAETKPMVNLFTSAIVDTHRTYVEAGRIPKKICAPTTVSADDLTATLCGFLEDHPEMASHSGAQVAIIAMVSKWPCSK